MHVRLASTFVSVVLLSACGTASTPEGGSTATGQTVTGDIAGGGATATGVEATGAGSTATGATSSVPPSGGASATGSTGDVAGATSAASGDAGAAGSMGTGGNTTGSGGMPSAGGAAAGRGMGGESTAGGNTSAGGATGGSGGGTDGTCTRETLKAATESLAAALGAGDSTQMSLAAGATYIENFEDSEFGQGVWQSGIDITFQRDFLDVDTCETFSEITVTSGTKLVLGVRLTLAGTDVSEVSALVSDSDDWAFDADNYESVSSQEDWSDIPEADQDTRETLIAAGDAYFNLFDDKSVEVPWNTPCTRLEGGQFTTGSTCDVGVPEGITFADKHWVVDRVLGTAIGMVRFGGSGGLPDSHMFRCLDGKIRYVHTITICDGGC